MIHVVRGRVQDGGIVFSEPLTLPEGSEVTVYIEPLAGDRQAKDTPASEEFASLPFFGMWANEEELSDSASWVRRKREQWQQRATRQD